MESREAERNPVRDDLGESIVEELGWYHGVLMKVIVGSEVRGDICVLDKFTSPTQPECCSRHREIVFSAMPASDVCYDFCFTILNVRITAVCSYHSFIRAVSTAVQVLYTVFILISPYDALSVIKFCILTDRINGGYSMLVCSNFLNQMGTGEGCKHLVINHKLCLILHNPKVK